MYPVGEDTNLGKACKTFNICAFSISLVGIGLIVYLSITHTDSENKDTNSTNYENSTNTTAHLNDTQEITPPPLLGNDSNLTEHY